MTAPVKLNFKIYQGATFRETLRWESSTKVYKPITAITKSAPIQITAPVHEVPEGWRIKVTNVQGMKEINSTDVYRTAHVTSADVLEINDINAVGFSDYTSGGIIEYNEPVSLATVTARMQFREKLDSEVALLELTTENGGIVIDDVNKTITIVISATQSAAFNWSSAVYSLELVRGSDVTQFITGNAQLIREVTR